MKQPARQPRILAARLAPLAVGIAAVALAGCAAAPADGRPALSEAGRDEPTPAAPKEVGQFAFMVGDWDMESHDIGEDGSLTLSGRHYFWRAYFGLGGFAIIDEWFGAPPGELEKAQHRGVNVRLYDPELGHWRIMWQSTSEREVTVLHGRRGGGDGGRWGEMVLADPLATQSPRARIRFYDIGSDSFMQAVERTDDDGRTWKPLEVLRATRIAR